MRDRDEIDKLYKHHGPALVLFAASIAGSRSSAQDAVHKVFVKLLEKRAKDRVTDPKAYLFASVRSEWRIAVCDTGIKTAPARASARHRRTQSLGSCF